MTNPNVYIFVMICICWDTPSVYKLSNGFYVIKYKYVDVVILCFIACGCQHHEIVIQRKQVIVRDEQFGYYPSLSDGLN